MKFDEIVEGTLELLRRRGRVTYRTLKRQFALDDATLDDLKHEIIRGLKLALDEEGEVLVWIGAHTTSSSPSLPIIEVGAPLLTPSTPTVEIAEPVERAERRQITLMFCDLVGSTKLSSELDPEDFRDLVRVYQRLCGDEIARCGGYVAQYLGDGILAYFGWPTAHEDEAERAVRAALAAVDLVTRASTPVSRKLGIKLSMRVGIHTGVVVVGEIGSGEGRQNLAMGEAPNVAARVQALAEADTVVITETTQKLVAKRLELAEFDQQRLHGSGAPVRLYRVIGESTDRGKDETRAIIGRIPELELLRGVFADLQTGKGAAVLVSGEAGIGKSRLTRAARDLAGEGVMHYVLQCSQHQTNTVLHPVVEQIERRAGITRTASVAQRRTLLRDALAKTSLPTDRAFLLIAQLISIATAEESAEATSRANLKTETLELIGAWIADDARAHPMLLLWEDAHWADATTLELLGMLAAVARTLPVVHIITYRPELVPTFASAPGVKEIALTRFSDDDAQALVTQMLDGKRMSNEVLALIAEKTDGIPLFIEEVAKVLVERGDLVERNGVLEPKGALSAVTVPSTLHDSLMARLDRMSSAREVAQLGATIGREFGYELLAAIASVDEAALRHCLRQLVDAEILFQAIGTDRYVFKHALIQDVAYQSLLRTTRQRHHERIARVLEERFPNVVERQPEVIAHHYGAAGMPNEALFHHRRAGERAVQQSAYIEALAHFSRALDDLALIPPSTQRDRDELDLHILRGVPLTATRGYGAPEVLEGYARARTLADALGETTKLFPSLYGQWRSSLLRAEYVAGLDIGKKLLAIGEKLPQPSFRVAAHRAIGSISFYLGDYERAMHEMEWVIASPLVQDEVRRDAASYEVVDSYVTAHSYLAWASWMRGSLPRALHESEIAVDMANEVADGFTRGLALSFASWLHQFRRDVAMTRAVSSRALAVSTSKGLEMWVGWSNIMQGWTFSEEGRHDEAVATIRAGIDAWRATGSQLGLSYFWTLLAEAEGKMGEPTRGLATLEQATAFASQHRERYYACETLRTRGELLHQAGEGSAVVESVLLKALDEAWRTGASMLAIRSAASLVRCVGKKHTAALVDALNAVPSAGHERDVVEAARLVSG